MKNLDKNWNEVSPEDKLKFDPQEVFNSWLGNHHISNTAYPLTPAQVRPYKIKKEYTSKLIKKTWWEVSELWLYVHIPFCEKRCKFCEYTVADETSEIQHEKYINLLKKEFKLYSDLIETKNKKLIWFDIWGWTPWVLTSKQIWEVLDMAKESFGNIDWFDISIETTPKIASSDLGKLSKYWHFDKYILNFSNKSKLCCMIYRHFVLITCVFLLNLSIYYCNNYERFWLKFLDCHLIIYLSNLNYFHLSFNSNFEIKRRLIDIGIIRILNNCIQYIFKLDIFNKWTTMNKINSKSWNFLNRLLL